MPFETIAPPNRLYRKFACQLRHMFDALRLPGIAHFAPRSREAIRSACTAMGDHLRNSQERFSRSISTPGIRQGVAKEVAGAR